MIFVAGDSFVDRYTFGDVTRLSPDAPVPVVRVTKEDEREGGAANVANTVEAMGQECILLESPSGPIVKHRILGRGYHIVRVDYDVQLEPISVEAVESVLNAGDILILVDYGKGSLVKTEEIIESAKECGAKILVDPKGHDWRRYSGVDLIKPNRDEMREMIGGWSSDDELAKKVGALQNEARIDGVLVTLAERGMRLIRKGELTVIEPRWVDVVCHSGAGEASIAAMAVALAEGKTMEQGAWYAARAGEAACTGFGTIVVRREEVFVDRVEPLVATLSLAH